MADANTRQIPPLGDQPFVDDKGVLTLYAFQFLSRLITAVSGSTGLVPQVSGPSGLVQQINGPGGLAEQVTALQDQSDGQVQNGILAAQITDLQNQLANFRSLVLAAGEDVALPPVQMPVEEPALARLSPVFVPDDALPPLPPAGQDIVVLHNGARVIDGNGSPAGVMVGYIGDMYLRRDGGAATTLYVKESGSNTSAGWVAK